MIPGNYARFIELVTAVTRVSLRYDFTSTWSGEIFYSIKTRNLYKYNLCRLSEKDYPTYANNGFLDETLRRNVLEDLARKLARCSSYRLLVLALDLITMHVKVKIIFYLHLTRTFVKT